METETIEIVVHETSLWYTALHKGLELEGRLMKTDEGAFTGPACATFEVPKDCVDAFELGFCIEFPKGITVIKEQVREKELERAG